MTYQYEEGLDGKPLTLLDQVAEVNGAPRYVGEPRGRCSSCPYSWRLRKDGTVQRHYLYYGAVKAGDPCEGSHQPPGSNP